EYRAVWKGRACRLQMEAAVDGDVSYFVAMRPSKTRERLPTSAVRPTRCPNEERAPHPQDVAALESRRVLDARKLGTMAAQLDLDPVDLSAAGGRAHRREDDEIVEDHGGVFDEDSIGVCDARVEDHHLCPGALEGAPVVRVLQRRPIKVDLLHFDERAHRVVH